MLYGFIILLAAAHAHGLAYRSRGFGNVLLVLCFVYWGLSYCNGYDWINYFAAVECERLSNCEEAYVSFEPLFLLLTKIASWTDYQIIPLTVGSAGVLTIRRLQSSAVTSGYAVLYLLSVAAFYLYIEQVRQGIALALLFIVADRLVRKHWRSAFWIWIVALQFHWTSALFVIPAFLTLASKRQALLATTALIGSVVVAALSIEAIVSFAAQSPFSGLSIFKRLFFYAATEDLSSSSLGIGFALDLAMLLLVLIGGRGIGNAPGANFRLTVIFYFVLLLVSRINIAIYRVSIVFLPFVCVYLSMLTCPNERPLRFLGGPRITRRVIGLALAVLCLGQAARPFTDPVLRPAMLHHELFGLTALPSDENRQTRSIANCDQLDRLDKGFLCGRW